jgi:8-oxo-dGTP pyrophosphatase MutT (NUDIX family)
MINLDSLTSEAITSRLALAHTGVVESLFPPELLADSPRLAAVLLPLLRREGSWHLLLIRRSQNHRDPHSGQVAFPGGASDASDCDPVETALREASEEIGLNPQDVQILGHLDEVMTITSYRVTPVIGVIPWPYPLQLAANEVSRAFTIPLNWLADPSNRRTELRFLPAPYNPIPVTYYQSYDGEILWGASAGFILRLLRVLSSVSVDE